MNIYQNQQLSKLLSVKWNQQSSVEAAMPNHLSSLLPQKYISNHRKQKSLKIKINYHSISCIMPKISGPNTLYTIKIDIIFEYY